MDIAVALHELCERYHDRHLGSKGNLHATAYFAEKIRATDFDVVVWPLDVVDWRYGDASLTVGGMTLPLVVGPYSLPADGEGEFVVVSTVEELEAVTRPGVILLLHGDLVRQQLTPKNYPFYNTPESKRVVAAIEKAAPLAAIAATGRNSGVTGGLYPFPLIEDADVDVASACLTDEAAVPLLRLSGSMARVSIDAERFPGRAEQVVARKQGRSSRRVVVSAHIDSRFSTPGAIDNAASVAVLLELAELASGRELPVTLELVPFNGEDDYAAPGEVRYLTENEGRLGDIVCAINLDAAGCDGQPTDVSFYSCPAEVESAVRAAMDRHPDIAEGPQWPQSDHMVFAMRGIPAVAITSHNLYELAEKITHTERDTVDLVDPGIVAVVARFVLDVVDSL